MSAEEAKPKFDLINIQQPFKSNPANNMDTLIGLFNDSVYENIIHKIQENGASTNYRALLQEFLRECKTTFITDSVATTVNTQ